MNGEDTDTYRFLYQIIDKVGETVLGPPWAFRGNAPAIRAFIDLLEDNTTQLAKHPADYELVLIGRQSEQTGAIGPTGMKLDGQGNVVPGEPIPIASGAQWAAQKERTAG